MSRPLLELRGRNVAVLQMKVPQVALFRQLADNVAQSFTFYLSAQNRGVLCSRASPFDTSCSSIVLLCALVAAFFLFLLALLFLFCVLLLLLCAAFPAVRLAFAAAFGSPTVPCRFRLSKMSRTILQLMRPR